MRSRFLFYASQSGSGQEVFQVGQVGRRHGGGAFRQIGLLPGSACLAPGCTGVGLLPRSTRTGGEPVSANLEA